ncbi:MAG: hypothetical protein ACJAVS_001534 [Paracoccaceae bacterium]|jgi:hypothetical protein
MSVAANAFRLCLLILAAVAVAVPAAAQTPAPAPLSAPVGDPLLTISGAVAVRNAEAGAVFDRAMLEALPSATIVTSTPWTIGVHSFTGVPLRVLLARVGVAKGAKLMLLALNDYEVEISGDDIQKDTPVVAYALDGEAMSVRSRGPLWVMYPFDADGRWRTELVMARSIWQLDRIRVAP